MHYISYFFPAIQCPALSISNAHLNLVVTDKGYVALVECNVGSTMPDGTRRRSLLCSGNGDWHSTGITCKRKNLYLQQFNLKFGGTIHKMHGNPQIQPSLHLSNSWRCGVLQALNNQILPKTKTFCKPWKDSKQDARVEHSTYELRVWEAHSCTLEPINCWKHTRNTLFVFFKMLFPES